MFARTIVWVPPLLYARSCTQYAEHMYWCRFCGSIAVEAMCCAQSDCQKRDLESMLGTEIYVQDGNLSGMTFTGSSHTITNTSSTAITINIIGDSS